MPLISVRHRQIKIAAFDAVLMSSANIQNLDVNRGYEPAPSSGLRPPSPPSGEREGVRGRFVERASSTIKPLARSRLRVVWLIGACVLVSGAIGLSLRSNRRAERALDRLLTAPLTIWRSPPETFDNFSDRELAVCMTIVLRSETNCVPYLCRELRRRETAFDRFYVARWRTLPAFLTRFLPEPVSVRTRRLRAITLLQCLGHGAVRPAAGTLIETLSDPTPEIAAQAASALGLVLPESPRARGEFIAYFQRARGGEFLGAEMWSAEFWKDIPELLPQLVRQLGIPCLAGDAARALDVYGTNAAPALPALVEAATDGFAGGEGRLEKVRRDGISPGLAMRSWLWRRPAYETAACWKRSPWRGMTPFRCFVTTAAQPLRRAVKRQPRWCRA